VLIRAGPRWLIEQYVLSITVPNHDSAKARAAYSPSPIA